MNTKLVRMANNRQYLTINDRNCFKDEIDVNFSNPDYKMPEYILLYLDNDNIPVNR